MLFRVMIHFNKLLIFVAILTDGAVCADWEAFQGDGSTSDNVAAADSFTVADLGALDPFISEGNLLPNPTLDMDSDESVDLFGSGQLSTASNPSDSPSLVGDAKDSCNLPPTRRKRARADDNSCLNNDVQFPNFNLDILPTSDESLQLPRYGRKITNYEDAEQRLVGQAYCPSDKINLPSLIIPVCNSLDPGLTQPFVVDPLVVLLNGFMSM